VDLFADKLASQIPEADRELVNSRLLAEYNCYPVYLSDELADMHYNGEPKKRDRV
jgi:trehalose 6-phosphate synthase